MKKLLLLACLLTSLGQAMAQQRPQFSQYFTNTYLNNPAVTGAYDYADLRLGYRNQWTGFDNAPQTVVLSGHAPLKLGGGIPKPTIALPTIGTYQPALSEDAEGENTRKGFESTCGQYDNLLAIRHGIGGLLFYDQTGPNSRIMFNISYAIHFPIAQKMYFSLGLQGGLINYSQDFSDLDPLNNSQTDLALQDGTVNSLEGELGAGAMLYNKKFFVGFTATQLLNSQLSFSDVQANELVPHYFVTGGYRFCEVFRNVDLIPTALLKILEASPASLDLSARLAYRDVFWFGLGYRGLRLDEATFGEDAASVLIGFNISSIIDLNYSFDYTFSDLANYSPNAAGSHEISLGIKLGNELKTNRLF